MGYCTIADLKKAVPESVLVRLTDDESTGSINTDRANEAIDTAAQEINSYIGGRVALPITGTVPGFLAKLNADMALYNLYARVKEEIPETRTERYKNAVRFLERFAKGEVSLGIQPPPEAPAEEEYPGRARTSVRDKIFTETELDKY